MNTFGRGPPPDKDMTHQRRTSAPHLRDHQHWVAVQWWACFLDHLSVSVARGRGLLALRNRAAARSILGDQEDAGPRSARLPPRSSVR